MDQYTFIESVHLVTNRFLPDGILRTTSLKLKSRQKTQDRLVLAGVNWLFHQFASLTFGHAFIKDRLNQYRGRVHPCLMRHKSE